ncbi:MAG: aminotransferase class V-fold PLP-dependent enzyme, partial [Clostridia bacterium]|nr:aminotransferase class V-fold PLP-dependent enzyme [Clostridia bacterium]
DIRPGTEALPLIAAFAIACDKTLSASNISTVEKLRYHLIEQITEKTPPVTVNIPQAYVPHVVSLTLPSIKSEVMLRYLSAKDIYVSAGSACTSKHRENRVLAAFGLDTKSADYTIRISFCEYNTFDEVDTFVSVLSDGIRSLVSTR